jgi:hypothetical protein
MVDTRSRRRGHFPIDKSGGLPFREVSAMDEKTEFIVLAAAEAKVRELSRRFAAPLGVDPLRSYCSVRGACVTRRSSYFAATPEPAA